jgi:hypothetical protein
MEACRKIFIKPNVINVLIRRTPNEIMVSERPNLSWNQNSASLQMCEISSSTVTETFF